METENIDFESSADEMNREMRQQRKCDFCNELFRAVELSTCKVDDGEKVELCEGCMSDFDELKAEYIAECCNQHRQEIGSD